MATLRVGILVGSSRPTGNAKGLERWLQDQLSVHNFVAPDFEVVHIFPNAPMHPLGPIIDETISALVPPSSDGSYREYSDEKIREWSKMVTSCHGFIILTPQHNWGYPGELKTALDHVFHEWRGKPVTLVTYGGHGGARCAEQLRQVLEGGLKMKALPTAVHITLPSESIRSTDIRLNGTEEFLKGDEVNSAITAALTQLREELTSSVGKE